MFCNKTKHSLRQKNENLFNSKNFLQLKELLMPFALRLFSRRDLPLNKRDWLSLNSMDRILIHQIQQQLLSTVHVLKIVNTLPTFPKVGKIALIHILASLHQEYTRLFGKFIMFVRLSQVLWTSLSRKVRLVVKNFVSSQSTNWSG